MHCNRNYQYIFDGIYPKLCNIGSYPNHASQQAAGTKMQSIFLWILPCTFAWDFYFKRIIEPVERYKFVIERVKEWKRGNIFVRSHIIKY